jgi:4-hydroxy-3-polyprenylbenzoate decarboxylase
MQETIGEGHVRVKPREPPAAALRMHLGHLRAMTQATEIGAIIAAPLPAFSLKPRSLAELVDHIACRAINLLNLPGVSAPAQSWLGEAAHP